MPGRDQLIADLVRWPMVFNEKLTYGATNKAGPGFEDAGEQWLIDLGAKYGPVISESYDKSAWSLVYAYFAIWGIELSSDVFRQKGIETAGHSIGALLVDLGFELDVGARKFDLVFKSIVSGKLRAVPRHWNRAPGLFARLKDAGRWLVQVVHWTIRLVLRRAGERERPSRHDLLTELLSRSFSAPARPL